MGIVIPPTSPWTYYVVTDNLTGQIPWISITFTFDGTWTHTTPLTGCVVYRANESPYKTIVLGNFNPDGTYPPETKLFHVPLGYTNLSVAQLNANGLFTVNDVITAPQINAVP